jgi:hypothetical protein
MSIAVLILILALIVFTSCLGGMWLLRRWIRTKNEATELLPEIEQEMTVSELNSLIEDRELAARAPLEDKIVELEVRLSEHDQEIQGPKGGREPHRS